MHKFKRISLKIAAFSSASLLLVAVPVYAERGSSNFASENNPGVQVAENATDDSSGNTTTSGRSEMRQKAQAMVAELKKNHEKKSNANIQKTCESHKQGLNRKFDRIVTNSQRIQDRITKVFDKAQAYQQDKNLNPANYDELVAKANDAKSASQDSIDALKQVKPTLDCNNTSVANDVATFKTSAQDTRAKLKAYRTAVKDVVKALRDATQASHTTGNEGSNQ
jgi:chromosome segregation ATPase